MGVHAHASRALGGLVEDGRNGVAVLVEQLLGTVAMHPVFKLAQAFGMVGQVVERDLVGAPGAFDGLVVDGLGAGPPFRRAQDQHGPGWAGAAGRCLDGGDAVERVVERRRHGGVHGAGLVARDDDGVPAVATEQGKQLVLRDAGEDSGAGDLVAVEVQDRQHGAVTAGLEELGAVPARGGRAGFGLAVADDAGGDQAGVVEGGAGGMEQGIAEFAALVDAARHVGGIVAGDAAGKAELAEQAAHAVPVAGDARDEFGVAAFEPGAGDHAWAAVAGAADVDHVEVAGADDAVEVGVDEVQPGRGAPMAEQARLDLIKGQRRCEQGVVAHEVDLAHGEVVGRAPP